MRSEIKCSLLWPEVSPFDVMISGVVLVIDLGLDSRDPGSGYEKGHMALGVVVSVLDYSYSPVLPLGKVGSNKINISYV